MNLAFIDEPQEGMIPILISGPGSEFFSGKKYILVESENERALYEIRYEAHCSPFKDAIIFDDILAVGFEQHFYLFDRVAKIIRLNLQMEFYFGHLYLNNELLYVTDAGGVFCINKTGSIIWKNKELGIDGVIINEFNNDRIFGSGEWDPPGGWRDFILNKQTGLVIK